MFRKPSPEDEAKATADFALALPKTILVPTKPIRTAGDFINTFSGWRAFRFCRTAVEGDMAMEAAAEIRDWMQDVLDGWRDCTHSQRFECARDFAEICERLERAGYLCHMGCHRQQTRHGDGSTLVLTVGVVSLLPAVEAGQERFALVELDAGWEVPEADRPQVPME